MNFWNNLSSIEQIEKIKTESENKAVLIFKHSTRCSTSQMVLDRLDRNRKGEIGNLMTPYFLDLISNRPVSNLIEEVFGVRHESPQVLLIEGGQCTYADSHHSIRLEDIVEKLHSKN